MDKYPGIIHTEQGFVFQIIECEGEKLIINQGKFVVYYDSINEVFYGVEEGQYVKRNLTPKHPELYRTPPKED